MAHAIKQSVHSRIAASLPQGANLRKHLTFWTAAAVVLTVAVTAPLVYILIHLFSSDWETWRHLASTVLWEYSKNTLILVLGVGALTFIIGVSTAWLTSVFEFPGSRFFAWALILPLAIPGYIMAHIYAGVFDFTSPIQTFLRELFSTSDGQVFYIDVMHIEIIVVILALALYPYVYLITRISFSKQSATLLEAARLHGKSSWNIFRRVALPLARPAIFAGLALVLMEVLNDYGAVKYFGVPTFTTGIFRAWLSLGDKNAAVSLAAVLLVFVIAVLALEKSQRGRLRFDKGSLQPRVFAKVQLKGVRAGLAFAVCAIPVTLGFILPVLQLGLWAGETAGRVVNADFFLLTLNSFLLASGASIVCLVAAILIVYAARLNQTHFMRSMTKISALGYSIPGAVIAIGVMAPFGKIDQFVISWTENYFGFSTGLLLSGTIFALMFAYLVRFLAVSLNPVSSGFANTCNNVDEASRSLGVSPLKTLFKIDLPILKGAIFGAMLLVFVDVLKELPLTLILRPFNFDTLAVKAFELASDELVAESANASLVIILTGLAPVIMLNRLMTKDPK